MVIFHGYVSQNQMVNWMMGISWELTELTELTTSNCVFLWLIFLWLHHGHILRTWICIYIYICIRICITTIIIVLITIIAVIIILCTYSLISYMDSLGIQYSNKALRQFCHLVFHRMWDTQHLEQHRLCGIPSCLVEQDSNNTIYNCGSAIPLHLMVASCVGCFEEKNADGELAWQTSQ